MAMDSSFINFSTRVFGSKFVGKGIQRYWNGPKRVWRSHPTFMKVPSKAFAFIYGGMIYTVVMEIPYSLEEFGLL